MARRNGLLYFISMVLIMHCGCGGEEELVSGIPENAAEFVEFIPSTTQRDGDANLGKDYLLYGDYIKSGLPKSIFDVSLGALVEANNVLDRSGVNEDVYFEYTSLIHPNGVEVVAPNCFQCHGGYVDNQFVLGLGNTFANFTNDQSTQANTLDFLVENAFGNPSLEWDAYFPFIRAVKATGKHLVTETVGANPADKLALVLAAHREKDNLNWIDDPSYAIPAELIPADVPAWWLLKKKSVMFSTGIGQGDFAKMMMASSILTLEDSLEARVIDDQFVNVKEFILSLDAPAYPREIDMAAAEKGKTLFELNCSYCHGTYGENESYSTQLVDLELVKTDPHLAQSNYAYADFENWFNTSWFGVDAHPAQIVPGNGYIAQPLDGVWATAPYFHNGSVPTLEDVLNSSLRPTFWRKESSFDNYDHQKMGLKYTSPQSKVDAWTYDTNLVGYGNQGHTFGDHLTEEQRADLIEYLKTL